MRFLLISSICYLAAFNAIANKPTMTGDFQIRSLNPEENEIWPGQVKIVKFSIECGGAAIIDAIRVFSRDGLELTKPVTYGHKDFTGEISAMYLELHVRSTIRGKQEISLIIDSHHPKKKPTFPPSGGSHVFYPGGAPGVYRYNHMLNVQLGTWTPRSIGMTRKFTDAEMKKAEEEERVRNGPHKEYKLEYVPGSSRIAGNLEASKNRQKDEESAPWFKEWMKKK